MSDPLANHKCRPVAVVDLPGIGRDIWLGELLAPIPGHETETHCIHITTPYKSVVLGVNITDVGWMATFASIINEKPVNPKYIESAERRWRRTAREANNHDGV